MELILMTDSCCDLPLDFVKEQGIEVLPIRVNFQGEDIPDDLGETLTHRTFYEALRAGENSSTSQVNVYTFMEAFKKHLEEGNAVIYVGFSSALSGCVNSATIAMDTLREDYPEADITIIDTKSASLGLGLIVYYANERMKQGASKEEVISWIEENKLKVNHLFTVDDLGHLRRGGRVSATVATIGTVLNIKPMLQVNNEGQLIPLSKVRGRKKALHFLTNHLKEGIVNPERQVIFISHGDCIEEAEQLKAYILKETDVKDVIINPIGPAVGSHSGPGTIALFFLGRDRMVM